MKFILIFLLAFTFVRAEFSETQAVAAVIIREAGGESHTGMWAVANVIHNRAGGRTPFAVISEPYQFSSVNSVVVTHKIKWEKIIEISMKHPEWHRALDLAKKIESQELPDITGGAINFYSGDVKPKWAYDMKQTAHIGGHYFYKNR